MSFRTVYDDAVDPRDKDRVVTMIRVTASGTSFTTPGTSNVFHWRFYLVITPGESGNMSVLVDMQPYNPTVPTIGVMIISSKEEKGSKAVNKVELDVLTRGSPTVSQIVSAFIGHKLDRYKFEDSSVGPLGCRYWVFTGLHVLEGCGFVEPGAVEKVQRFHSELAVRHPDSFPMPIRKGALY